jgi:drug/metabolite transporter (DMT)-like permease
LCYFKALQVGQASQVTPVDKLSVVFVAILGTLFLGESLTIVGWSGVALIAIGAVLVALPNLSVSGSLPSQKRSFLRRTYSPICATVIAGNALTMI